MGSLVVWMIHICWLASGPCGERFQWNLPCYFHISHFLPLVFIILPFTYFYSPRLFENGDIERAWLMRSVVSNTLIHFEFYTFLSDTRITINIGAILLASVLYCYMRIFVLRSLYGVLVHLHTFTHYFSHLYWSVAGASWLIWLLCMDTVETTLSDQFFAFNSVNGSCKSI